MSKEPERTTRKSVTLSDSMWAEISEFRFVQRIATEAEAVRRLLQSALSSERKRAAMRAAKEVK